MTPTGRAQTYLLAWRANGDGYDVALVANRLLAAAGRVWRVPVALGAAAAGDYLVELAPGARDALARIGVAVSEWQGDVPGEAQLLVRPHTCLFAGTASKFPYFAYYTLALLRLGIDYVPCDGDALAHGVLDRANLLVLPGGFATWGIDAAENAPGADARVRDFLARGGTAIGSCGGAYYLSAGRPAWTGTAQAKPLYTHEYLQTGVGIVALAMRPGPLALGCAPTIEVPYYHGPIYDLVGPGSEVAATFHALALPGRLAIDNPLDSARFERDMQGKPAILLVAGERGRAVLFSPHPEMGDLVRKYIALDGYVRHYLPIRGFGTMRDTLRHYRVADAPSFRLIVNAVHELMTHARAPAAREDAVARTLDGDHERSGVQPDPVAGLVALCRRALAALPDFGAGEEGELLRDIAQGIGARLDEAARRASALAGGRRTRVAWWPALAHVLQTMEHHLGDAVGRTVAQQLMELELGVAILGCSARALAVDRALAEGP